MASIRFSVSALFGFLITTALFIGMLSLLGNAKTVPSSADVNIDFSFVKEFEEPKVESPTDKEPPKPEEVVQPPAAPTLAVSIDNSPVIQLPIDGIGKSAPDLLPGIGLPGLIGSGQFSENQSGGIKAAIAPMYPQQELMKKTEGWVKLKITVDEFGGVGSVSIIDAQPKRVFNAAAKKAIKKWKFHPKVVDGKAVSFVATQTIEFKINQ